MGSGTDADGSSARTEMACRRDVAASARTLSNRSLRSRYGPRPWPVEEIGGGGSSSSTSSAPSSSFALFAPWLAREPRSAHTSLDLSSAPHLSGPRPIDSLSRIRPPTLSRVLSPRTPRCTRDSTVSFSSSCSSVSRYPLDNRHLLPRYPRVRPLSRSGTLCFPRRSPLIVSPFENAFSGNSTR